MYLEKDYRRIGYRRVGQIAIDELYLDAGGSHHLQVKAALALLYHVLGSPNPFAQCPAPKFAPEKTELRYHTASQIEQLLHELRKDRRSYFGHLSYHLATALFFTGCRYHEWALLTVDRLVREPGGVIITARLQVKGGSFRDLPLTTELSDSLEEWFAFLESVKGVRLRTGGIDFAGSALVFPGRDGPVISAHPLRHTAAPPSCSTSAEPTCRDVQALLGHKSIPPDLDWMGFPGHGVAVIRKSSQSGLDYPVAAQRTLSRLSEYQKDSQETCQGTAPCITEPRILNGRDLRGGRQ